MSPPTTISKRYVTAAAFLGIVLLLTLPTWDSKSPGNPKSYEALHGHPIADKTSSVSPKLGESIRTKSRIRTNHPKPTIEETIELCRTTIIPILDLPPDQPLSERIARINELIQKAGVEPHRLRLIVRSADPANQLRFRDEMRIREIPLGIALKYLCDSTKLRYHVRENGIIELTTLQDQDPMPGLPNPQRKAAHLPSDKTDAFGNNVDESEGADPFTVPSAR